LAEAAVCPSRLSFSSFIVDPFEWLFGFETERARESKTDGRKPRIGGFAATDPGRLASPCRVRRSQHAFRPAVGTYCVSLALRAIADSGAARDPAGADHGGQIFENFRYHRTFIGGSHDVALEFAANIGKWQLKGIDLIKFNEAGEMLEFEVMIRPIKALTALGEEMGNRIGPQLALLKQAAGA
jgi:hypothetical protein